MSEGLQLRSGSNLAFNVGPECLLCRKDPADYFFVVIVGVGLNFFGRHVHGLAGVAR